MKLKENKKVENIALFKDLKNVKDLKERCVKISREAYLCYAEHGSKNMVKVMLKLRRNRISYASIDSSFIVKPRSFLHKLEEELFDVAIDKAEEVMLKSFRRLKPRLSGVAPEDFVELIKRIKANPLMGELIGKC